jgi:hypothetical protein
MFDTAGLEAAAGACGMEAGAGEERQTVVTDDTLQK